jgi:hypothetical protein
MLSKLNQIRMLGAIGIGIGLMAFCGSWLGGRIGLHGFDQWPLVGFAVGLLITSQAPLLDVRERLRSLERRIEDIQKR